MIILYILGVILYPIFCFGMYNAIMNLMDANDKGLLRPEVQAAGYILLAFGWPMNFILNHTYGTLLFLDRPRGVGLTDRVSYWYGDPTWRGVIAEYICHVWLNIAEEDGVHCNPKRNRYHL